ncbi:hypothetical protein Poli38472_013051 [Pythium oligandrum]|uniref:EF-hand domain-containing protein n=1 Tax=Pythium oligandrum TaxID=41045 RepID=A0A8K1CJX2_PYTOL|nr:hypothetical protein Poli38472_013051 [Pythium oligandrum]|eukprot:TMW64429.1 hypothetical protein Poli38472_013051 [Pythium oligandrum]
MAQPAGLAVDTEAADAAMPSPSSSIGRTDPLRLSEIESAHLCPSGRMKMEELFRQWLNVEGTKEMISGLVEDVRNGKEVNLEAMMVSGSFGPHSGSGADMNSPARSPKRPPNYHHFGANNSPSPSSSASNSPLMLARKKNPIMSLFGQDLQLLTELEKQETPDVVMNETEEAAPAPSENNNEEEKMDAPPPTTSPQIPRFYIPGESRRGRLRTFSTDTIARKASDIDGRFQDFPDGMKVEDFVAITKDLCGFPSFFNAPFFRRILAAANNGELPSPTATDDSLKITKEMFLPYWQKELAPFDDVERFFRVVKQPQNSFIERDDFAPFLHELLKYHPGLEFLAGTPEFQEKYALTVVVRIFYSVDRDSSGKITLRKLRRSNLLESFNTVDEEEDINKVNAYFSYEHFYVLYCKFWELDTDHDFQLSPDDLARYGGHSLTRIIVDRIFEHGRRPFARVQNLTPEEKKKMSYEDFIYFMLSEEDKSNPISLQYWFELVDTNEDGVIRSDEMRVFYRHQMHRMECLGHEVVPFEDILCQMSDLLHPAVEGEFFHKDFIKEDKIRVSGVFFNVLFNLSKFIEFEQRDPFLLRQQLAEPELTDWDRYARAEYARLAMEEEGREDDSAMDIDTMDGWYVSDEQEDDAELMVSAASTANRTVEAPF